LILDDFHPILDDFHLILDGFHPILYTEEKEAREEEIVNREE
jgi:hypothetical protein